MTGFIYILHFHTPFSHAQHYTGSTAKLKMRLMTHANGHGATLTREIMAKGIEWTLGALGTCSLAAMRRIERSLKNQHNAKRFCALCTPDAKRIADTQSYPIEAVSFLASSQALRLATNSLWKPPSASVRFTTSAEPLTTQKRIVDLMRKDKDALGFIPIGGKQGIQLILDKGLVCMVSNNGEDVGYSAFTLNPSRTQLNIHQCAVADDARLCGHGKAMVDAIAAKFPTATICAKVREDLTANEFWLALGFTLINSRKHETSGNIINQYYRPAIIKEF